LRLSQAPGTLGHTEIHEHLFVPQEEVPVAAAQPTPLPAPAGPVERLSTAAAGELAGRDLDVLADQQLQADLKALEQVRRRTEAHQIALANTLKTRQARRLTDRGVEAGKAARQADRATRQELTNELHWSPSDARRATRLGGELTAAGTSSQAREQFADGGSRRGMPSCWPTPCGTSPVTSVTGPRRCCWRPPDVRTRSPSDAPAADCSPSWTTMPPWVTSSAATPAARAA
jgi:hypothetical protein